MKNSQIIIIAIILFLLITPVVFWFSIKSPVETIVFPAIVKVNSTPAFALTDEPILRLGTVPPSLSANRGFNVTNTHDFPVRVLIDYTGDEWLYLSVNELALEPGETQNVMVQVRIPENAEFGEYEWTMMVKLFKR